MKYTLILMRGGIVFSIVVCSAFLFARNAIAGGIPGDVIDYTLLKKLQEEYATSSEEYMRQPRISATSTTEMRSEKSDRARPADAVGRAGVRSEEDKNKEIKKKPFLEWLREFIKDIFF